MRAIQLETGESDSPVWPLVTEDNLRFAEDPNFTTCVTSSLAVNHFPLNDTHPILSDRAVRRALMHAKDRQRMIDDIFLGAAVLAISNLAPALEEWYEPDVARYDYDPDRAIELLEEAGWVEGPDSIRERDGERLSFTRTVISGDEARRPQAVVAQEGLRAVGIEMNIAEASVATILEQMRQGQSPRSSSRF